MIRAFIYFFLTSLSALGDNVFLYFVSFMLASVEGRGGLLSGIVLGLDAFFEILIGPILAKFTDRIPELHKRLRFARLIYLFSMPLAIIPFIKFNPSMGGIVWLIVAVSFIRMLLLFDQQLQSAIPLHLEKREKLHLARSISFFTFTQRSIPLLSSSLATLLLGSSLIFVSSLNSLSYLLGIIGLIFILQHTQLKCTQETPEESSDQKEGSLTANQKVWTYWYCLLQFLTCLAFGSVVLILSRSVVITPKNLSSLERIMYGPGTVYTGMLLALVFITIFPKKSQWFSRDGKNVCYLPMVLGISIIFLGLTEAYLQVFFLFITGIVNGFSLVALNTYSQRKFEGKDFVKALAKSQAARKIGMLLSLLIAGFCFDLRVDANHLLFGFGLLGLIVSAIMLLLANNLEPKFSQRIEEAV